MFGWIRKRDPRKDLQRRYEAAMQAARDIQRRGDIVAYAARVAEADEIGRQLDDLERRALDTGVGSSRS